MKLNPTLNNVSLYVMLLIISGLRGEEISYVFNTKIWNNLSGCNCSNLHVINEDKKNENRYYSVIVINRTVGQKHLIFL